MRQAAIRSGGVAVLALMGAGAWAAQEKVVPEVIRLAVNVGAQVCKVETPEGISLCSVNPIPFEPVAIVLVEQPTSDPSYAVWVGEWAETTVVHGLTFEGHLSVTKQEHRSDVGISSWYNFRAEIRDASGQGPTMSFHAGQVSDLRGITLNATPIVQGDYVITPELYVGPALTLQPGPIITTTPLPIPFPSPTGVPAAPRAPTPIYNTLK